MALTISGSSVLAAPVTAGDICAATGDNVGFHVLMEIKWNGAKPGVYRTIYQVNCEVNEGCDGVSLSLGNLEKGAPVHILDLNRMKRLSLLKMLPNVAIIAWAPYATFTVDNVSSTVTYRFSRPDGAEGYGVTRC